MEDITIRSFAPEDQDAARRLVLQGLGEHFGSIDESANADLEDIASSFRNAFFLVAVADDKLVGTGALVPMGRVATQIVRMSVERDHRRNGIARLVLTRLLEQAREDGHRWAVLETNADWADAIAFYKACGFSTMGRGLGGVAFAFDLQREGGRPPWPTSWLLIARIVWRHYRSR